MDWNSRDILYIGGVAVYQFTHDNDEKTQETDDQRVRYELYQCDVREKGLDVVW
jgi:hypothetical protein